MDNEELIKLAFEDFINGYKLNEIAKKYDIKLNTIRSWRTKFDWVKKKASKIALTPEQNLKLMRNNLIEKLYEFEIDSPENVNLINSFISMNSVLIELDKDIKEFGVTLIDSKGDKKRNESVNQYEKTLSASLKIQDKIEDLFISVEKENDEYGL